MGVCMCECVFSSFRFHLVFWQNFSFRLFAVRLFRVSEHFFEMPQWKAKSRRANALMIFRLPPHHQPPPIANNQQPTRTTTTTGTTTPSDSQRQGTLWWPRFSLCLSLFAPSSSFSFILCLFFFFGLLMMMFVAVCVCICHARHINLGEWHAWRLTERDYRVFSLPMPTRDPRPTASHRVPQSATECHSLRQVLCCFLLQLDVPATGARGAAIATGRGRVTGAADIQARLYSQHYQHLKQQQQFCPEHSFDCGFDLLSRL